MSEEIKDTTVAETMTVEEEAPKKGSKGRKKADKDDDTVVVANLNEWEAAPVRGTAPVKVEEHPNGITAYHY